MRSPSYISLTQYFYCKCSSFGNPDVKFDVMEGTYFKFKERGSLEESGVSKGLVIYLPV